ncbi:hypothetical protein [Tepidiforma sp.]|uniref:hypothetical protein n=1 Tax=Tepidiforma sp. TaxID=2682230 RepID=UPI002620BF8C|nr:hypothetical protein [Tepidiforma sp.]MCX7618276.1 hypothetical protein [Tepidiforma sp.]
MPSIQVRRSTTSGSEPGSMLPGELAANLADRVLYLGLASGFARLPAIDLAVLADAPFLPSPTTNWRCLWPFTGAGGTIAMTAGRCVFVPFVVWLPWSVTDLGIEVSTSSTGSAEAAIYASDGTSRRPGTRLAYVSGLDTGTTGVKSGAVSLTLPPGLYWAAVRCTAAATLRGAAGGVSFSIVTGGNNRGNHLFSSASSLANPVGTDPTSIGSGTVPHIYARWSA